MKFPVAASVATIAFCAGAVYAQCIEIPSGEFSSKTRAAQDLAIRQRTAINAAERTLVKGATLSEADKEKIRKTIQEEQQRLDPERDFVRVRVPKFTSIKLIADDVYDSGTAKTEDYIPFTVAQDVYAEDDVDQRDKAKPSKLRCVVIAAGTKVYGIVDYFKARSPFRLRGKARLYIYADSVRLSDTSEIKISFFPPEGLTPSASARRNDKGVKDCEIDRKRRCIVGRLSRSTFQPSLVGAGAGGITTFIGEDTPNSIAALSLVQGLANATGVGELVNGSHSNLRQKQVFEAKTLENRFIWAPTKRGDTPKNDAEKPKIP